jgi:hypothetical protein
VQHLQDGDYVARIDGCNALIQNIDNATVSWQTLSFRTRPHFTYLVVSIDITAGSGGKKTRMNCMSTDEIHKKSVCGVGWPKIGSMDLSSLTNEPLFVRQNGASYLNMLQNILVPELQQVRGLLRRVIFQQDDAPPHFALDVRAYLDQTFTDRWIGHAGSLAWPPRSSDLNPLDFYLWGHIKTNVYRTKPRSIDELKQRITDSVAAIPVQHPRNAFREFERRIHLIIVNNGAHVECY